MAKGALKLFLETIDEYDLNGILIKNDQQLANISQSLFGNWNYNTLRIFE